MTYFPQAGLWLVVPLALAACTQTTQQTSRPDATPEAAELAADPATAVTRAPRPAPAARATPAQLNTTSPAQRAAAAQPPAAAETRLGTTVASLGDPTRSGFWLRTPLVSEPSMGRLRNPENGRTAQVELLPLDGPASGGSQISLPAMQLLDISLTALPTLEVFRF